MLRVCFYFAALMASTGCLVLVDEYASGGNGGTAGTGGVGGSGGSGAAGSTGGAGGEGAQGGSGGAGGEGAGVPCVDLVGPYPNEPKPRYEIAFGPNGDVAILGDVSFACPGVGGFGLAIYAADAAAFDESVPTTCVGLDEPEEGTDYSVAMMATHLAVVFTPAGEVPALRVFAKSDPTGDAIDVVEFVSTDADVAFTANKVVASATEFFVGGTIQGAPIDDSIDFADPGCSQGETDDAASNRSFVLRHKPIGTTCAMMTGGGSTGDAFGDIAVNDAEVLVRTVRTNGDGRLLRLRQNFTVTSGRAEPGQILDDEETGVFAGLTGYGNGAWATLRGTSAQLGTTSCCPLLSTCCPANCCAPDDAFWGMVMNTNPITHQIRGIATRPGAVVPDAFGYGQTSGGRPRVTGYGLDEAGKVWGASEAEWPSARPGEVIGVQAGESNAFFYLVAQTCDDGWRIERVEPEQ